MDNIQAQDAIEPEVVPSEQVESHRPEDVAAAQFKKSEAVFPSMVYDLSLNQLQRVVLHTAFAGLSDKEYKLVSTEEKRVAYRFKELVTSYAVMQLAAEMEKVDKAYKAEQERTNTNVVIDTTAVKGETNG